VAYSQQNLAHFVQICTTETTSVASPLNTNAFTNSNTKGNTIVALLMNRGSILAFKTPTDHLGNKYNPIPTATGLSRIGSGIQISAFVAWNIVAGSGNFLSVSWTGASGSFLGFYLFEVSGVTAVAPSNTNANTSSTANAGNIWMPAPGIILGGTISASSATSPGTGYTSIPITSEFNTIMEYGLFGVGLQPATINLGSSGVWGMSAVGLYTPISVPKYF
jgi:hypothetical protein